MKVELCVLKDGNLTGRITYTRYSNDVQPSYIASISQANILQDHKESFKRIYIHSSIAIKCFGNQKRAEDWLLEQLVNSSFLLLRYNGKVLYD